MSALSEVRRHWPLLVAALLGGALINIPTYGLGIFMPIWEREFGWHRSEIGFALSFYIGVIVLCSPIAGWAVDRYGAKRPILLSALMMSAGLLLISRVGSEIWTLYAAYAAYAVLGAFGTGVTYTRSVAQYFDAGRGLALGIATTATSVALLVVPPLFLWLLDEMSWRMAWVAAAGIPLILFPLLLVGVKDTSGTRKGVEGAQGPGAGLGFREALASYRFWALGVAFLLTSFAVAGASFQMVPVLRDRGLSLEAAVAAQAMLGIGLAVARLVCGFILDHVFAPAVFGAIALSAALGFVGVALGPLEFTAVYLFFIGAALGAEGDVLAYLCARYFGLLSYAKVYGCLFGVMNAGAMLTPVVYGYLHDVQGSYMSALWLAATGLLVATFLVAMMGRYPNLQATSAAAAH